MIMLSICSKLVTRENPTSTTCPVVAIMAPPAMMLLSLVVSSFSISKSSTLLLLSFSVVVAVSRANVFPAAVSSSYVMTSTTTIMVSFMSFIFLASITLDSGQQKVFFNHSFKAFASHTCSVHQSLWLLLAWPRFGIVLVYVICRQMKLQLLNIASAHLLCVHPRAYFATCCRVFFLPAPTSRSSPAL